MEFCAEKLTVLFFILIHRVIEAPKVRPSVSRRRRLFSKEGFEF